jgi:hypothetical protein
MCSHCARPIIVILGVHSKAYIPSLLGLSSAAYKQLSFLAFLVSICKLLVFMKHQAASSFLLLLVSCVMTHLGMVMTLSQKRIQPCLNTRGLIPSPMQSPLGLVISKSCSELIAQLMHH